MNKNDKFETLSRRSVLQKGAVTGALVIAGTTVSGSAAAQPGERATGGVTYRRGPSGQEVIKVSFNAQGGNSPKGRVNIRNEFTALELKGNVNCYTQSGNRAVFSGRLTETSNPAFGWFQVAVEDNARSEGPDRVDARPRSTNPGCDIEDFDVPEINDVTEGNLQVHGQGNGNNSN